MSPSWPGGRSEMGKVKSERRLHPVSCQLIGNWLIVRLSSIAERDESHTLASDHSSVRRELKYIQWVERIFTHFYSKAQKNFLMWIVRGWAKRLISAVFTLDIQRYRNWANAKDYARQINLSAHIKAKKSWFQSETWFLVRKTSNRRSCIRKSWDNWVRVYLIRITGCRICKI